MQFLFAEHTLDIDRCELLRGSAPIAVEPQVFDLLVYLLQNRHLIRTVARKPVRFIGEVRRAGGRRLSGACHRVASRQSNAGVASRLATVRSAGDRCIALRKY